MSLSEGFFEVHKNLHREGPGLASDVVWALEQADLSGAVSICDAGCGPGADSETLVRALPDARVDAVDGVAQFVAEAQARLAGFGTRVTVRQGDMAQITGPYDLIWCAGALYFLGIEAGLTTWRDALTPNGWVAFSEPCYLSTPPSPGAQAFWAGEGDIGDIADIRARVAAADYEVHHTRMIIGAGWEAYYAPMQARIAALRAAGRGDELAGVIAESEGEIARWHAARDDIAYALMLVRPM